MGDRSRMQTANLKSRMAVVEPSAIVGGTLPKKTGAKGPTEAFRAQAGKGRPKGVPNKATTAIKEMVIAALNKAGGIDYLLEQASKNPTAFLTLVGKVLPLDVNANVNGQVTVHRIELVAPSRGGE